MPGPPRKAPRGKLADGDAVVTDQNLGIHRPRNWPGSWTTLGQGRPRAALGVGRVDNTARPAQAAPARPRERRQAVTAGARRGNPASPPPSRRAAS